MLATVASEIAWAIVALVALLVIGMLIYRGKIHRMTINAGPVHATMDLDALHGRLDRIEQGVAEVNESVNHRKAGDPTLVARVANIEEFVEAFAPVLEWQNGTLAKIAHHVGFRNLDSPPVPHVPQGAQSA